jgi:DTW domain-containing protein YfiP
MRLRASGWWPLICSPEACAAGAGLHNRGLMLNTPHAVSMLRTERLARSAKPFLARGGSRRERCSECRLPLAYCMCALCQPQALPAGFCLLMADIEPLKPSNTGWLVADVVRDTFAFGWARTEVDPRLLALLADPQWQPYVVFPGGYADQPERVVHALQSQGGQVASVVRPLFILLDATWAEARKMFRKSPYLDRFPVLSLQPEDASNYQLRHAAHREHLCTSEVAALCLALAGEPRAAGLLDAWLGVYTERYLQAKNQCPATPQSAAHAQLRACQGLAPVPVMPPGQGT